MRGAGPTWACVSRAATSPAAYVLRPISKLFALGEKYARSGRQFRPVRSSREYAKDWRRTGRVSRHRRPTRPDPDPRKHRQIAAVGSAGLLPVGPPRGPDPHVAFTARRPCNEPGWGSHVAAHRAHLRHGDAVDRDRVPVGQFRACRAGREGAAPHPASPRPCSASHRSCSPSRLASSAIDSATVAHGAR